MIYLVIKESFCPDYYEGKDTTDVEIGFTEAENLEVAMQRYPSKEYGPKFTVLPADSFYAFPSFRS